MTTKRNGQDTESNAHAISAFSRIEAFFLTCNTLAAAWTSLKPSGIKHPLMKAF
jgi:hypothetical protein